MLLRVANRIGKGVGAFHSRDNSLKPAKLIESIHRFIVGNGNVIYSSNVVEESVLGTDGGIVKTARYRINGSGVSVLVLEQIALETVEDSWFSESH